MNRRSFMKTGAGAVLGVSAASLGCRTGRERRLNVYNWENYVAAGTVPDFEREFDCRVRYATYGSAEEMLAKVIGGNSGWDVVFPSNSFIPPMWELGLLQELDHRKLPNLQHLDRHFQKPGWDPRLAHSTPFMYSATGIVYSRHVSREPRAWADLWTTAYGRRMTMLNDPAEVFAACLKRMGQSVNTTDEHQLSAARDLAIRQKPLLRAYLSEEVRDQVVTGDLLVAQMWAQVAQVAIDHAPHLAFTFPVEGFPLYADSAAILRESTHKDLAYEFVNYLLRPPVAAAIAAEMRTATANASARAQLPVAQRQNAVLYPGPDVLARGEWFRALPVAAQRLRDRYWTEIKSA